MFIFRALSHCRETLVPAIVCGRHPGLSTMSGVCTGMNPPLQMDLLGGNTSSWSSVSELLVVSKYECYSPGASKIS